MIGVVVVVALAFAASGVHAQTQTPPPPASLCAGRPANFLVRDVTQCNAFFRCAAAASAGAVPTFTRHLCDQPAHVFHQSQQRCVAVTLAGNAHCFRCAQQHALVDVPLADEASPSSSSCSRHFVRCLAGQAQQLECPAGTVFDRRSETCAPTASVQCDAPPPAPAVRCPALDAAGRRVWQRDAHDCSVFRVCVNGRAVRGQCAAGAHFNERTLTCDLPQSAGCRVAPPGRPPVGQPQPPVDPGTAWRPFRCAEQQPLARPIYPDARDCTRYWLCDVLHNAFPRQCPAGKRFDIVQQRCDSPQRAVCAPGTWWHLQAGGQLETGPWLVRNATLLATADE